MRRRYVIQHDKSSFCTCGKNVDLLCNEGGDISNFEWFYICWECKRVFQIGVGPVVDVTEKYGLPDKKVKEWMIKYNPS